MSNISDLSITIAEVAGASNLNINIINLVYQYKKSMIVRVSHQMAFSLNVFIFLGFSLSLLGGAALFIVGFFPIIIIAYVWTKILFSKRNKRFRHFLKLYIQILNFNSLIESAEALDEAVRSGGSNRLENREKVIKALTSIRADLISALRIEKAFRENPNFSSSSFTPNLEPLQVLQLSEQSSEYGRLFNEALQIGMNVQEEMQTLQRR